MKRVWRKIKNRFRRHRGEEPQFVADRYDNDSDYDDPDSDEGRYESYHDYRLRTGYPPRRRLRHLRVDELDAVHTPIYFDLDIVDENNLHRQSRPYEHVDSYDSDGIYHHGRNELFGNDQILRRNRNRYLLSMFAAMTDEDDARPTMPSPLPPAVEKSTVPDTSDTDPEQQMIQELSCPVCGNIFTDPVISPCLHSMCSSCAYSLLSKRGKCRCPVCKNEIRIDELKENYPLKGIVETFSQRRFRPQKDDIKDPAPPAEKSRGSYHTDTDTDSEFTEIL